MNANTTFAVTNWDEKSYDEFDGGRKLTRADVTFRYTGELEGEGKLQYLMAYAEDGTGNFVGMERITGRLGGRAGSFVAQSVGTFQGHAVQTTWTIVLGTGTGELQGLTGGTTFSIAGQGPYPMTLEYELG